jgi:hypothetical protein
MDSFIDMPGQAARVPEKSIGLETSKGRPVANRQVLETVISGSERWGASSTKSLSGHILRRGPSNIYNCHGLTFASRRTGIESDEAIKMILEDDDFRRIDAKASLPGDIVLYRDSSGDVQHSGILLQSGEDDSFNPKVLSKLGKWEEVIHHLKDCEYYEPDRTQIEFYRAYL